VEHRYVLSFDVTEMVAEDVSVSGFNNESGTIKCPQGTQQFREVKPTATGGE
jgi:hypothetical protein